MADGLRVLYVDDEPELLEMAKIFLEMNGEFSVGISTSAKEVISLPLTQSYDAIVSDYEMPVMNGIAFLKHVREQFGDIPFILFTGRGREEVVIDAINNGADFYLQKGGSAQAQFAELAHKIRQAVSKRQAQAQLREAYDRITASEEELARSELQLQESESKFRDFADNLPQMVFETDMDLRITYVNRYTADRYGFPPGAMGSGISVLTFIHPSQHAMFMENAHHLRYGIPFEPKEYTAFDKNGTPFPIIVYSSSIFRNKQMVGFRGVVADISERKQAEQALRESEQKYRTLVEVIQDIVYYLDPRGTIVYISPQVMDQLGYHPDEILGRNFSEFIHQDDARELTSHIRTSRPTGIPLPQDQFRVRRKDGTYRWYEDKSIRILNSRDEQVTIGIVRDITERKLGEEAVFQSQQMLQSVLDTIPQRVFWKDRDQIYLGCNKAFAADSGYDDPAGVAGTTDYNLVPFEAAEKFRADDSMVMKSGQPKLNVKERHTWPDGSISWLRSSKVPLRNREEEIVGVLGTYEDITEQQKAHEALLESEARLRLLTDNVKDVIWTADMDMHLTYVTPSVHELWGMTPEEAIAQPIEEALTPESLAVIREHYHRATSDLQDGKITPAHRPLELEFKRKDGSTVWTEVMITPMLGKDGLPTGVIGLTRDISQRRASETALRESEKMFSTIFRTSLVSLTLLSVRDNTFYAVNDAFIRNSGYSREEVLGKTPWEIGLLVDREIGVRIASVLKKERHIEAVEVPFRAKDGTVQVCLYSATLITMQGELFLLSSVIDISGRKNKEEALRQANHKLNILSGITRHDINNQLQALGGYVELLRHKVPDPAHAEDFSHIGLTIGQISNLIQFTKEYEMIGVHEPAWQNLHGLVAAAEKAALPKAIRCENLLPGDLDIFADPLISKVFFNLLDNAKRHGGSIQQVRFTLEENDGARIVVCSDDGIGVPPADKERIFAQGVGKNTGFGLAISREILDITGITIRETGEAGKGARFEITVPSGKHRMAAE